MTAHPTTNRFKDNAHEALGDAQLQKAMLNVRAGFIDKRAAVAAKLPEFEALRDSARDIKNHTLAHLDLYLERYEQKVLEAGGQVHWRAPPRRHDRSFSRSVTQPVPRPSPKASP